MIYRSAKDGELYLLNLIDTPGHVDFSYEVSRSLSACQGTLLLVDASQGIQAQTVANFFLAFGENIEVIPVINKIDLPGADADRVAKQIHNTFELDVESITKISAKSGLNVGGLFQTIIDRVPHPTANRESPLRALLFDSWYDNYVGVVCMLAVSDGCVKKGDTIVSKHTGRKYEVGDVGVMFPDQVSTGSL